MPAFDSLMKSHYNRPYPIIVAWISTLACNLRCIHCYPSSGKSSGDELTTDESRQILGEFGDIGLKTIFVSGGEPLLRPDLIELCKYAVDEGIKVCLCTNATLIDRKKANNLAKIGIEEIFVGLEGSTSLTVNGFSNLNHAYEEKIDGIKACLKAGLKTSIDFVCTKYNMHDLLNVINLAKDLGIHGLGLKRFVPSGRGKENLESLWVDPQDYERIINCFCEQSRINKTAMDFSAHEPLVTARLTELGSGDKFYISTCQIGIWCGVNQKGDVSPCPMLPLRIGNLKEQDLKSIWKNSQVIMNLRYRDKLKGKCGLCHLKYSCGGCRATAFSIFGDYLEEDPLCYRKLEDLRPID